MDEKIRQLYWVGSSQKDLKSMPDDVQDIFGYALHLAQQGKMHYQTKPMKGFPGAGVLEVVEEHLGDAFRAIYAVKLHSAVYVLHCFQKKSRRGIQTPKRDIDLIRQRLKLAREHAAGELT